MEGNELFHTGNIYVDNTLLILSFLAMVGFCLVMFIALFRIALGILLLFLGYAIYPFYVLYRLVAFLIVGLWQLFSWVEFAGQWIRQRLKRKKVKEEIPSNWEQSVDEQDYFYQVLGVSRTSSQEEIKKQYRRKVLQYHPDRNSSQEAALKYQEIVDAYNHIMSR